MQVNTGKLMLANLMNGIYTLKGSESAGTGLRMLRRIHIFPNIPKSRRRMVQGLGMKLDLKASKLRDIGALSKAKTGLYLVRLTRGNKLDDVVFVDCRKGWIMDSAEEEPLRLTEISFFLYAGERTISPHLAEVRASCRSTRTLPWRP